MKGTKGSIRKRGSGFQGRVDIGPDPLTGKRRVRYVSLAKKGAVQEKIAEILAELGKGEYIDPRKITFGEWLDTWYDTAVEGSKRPRTCERYRGIIDNHLKPALGAIVLQKLQAVDIEKYFRESTQSSTSLVIHLVVISSALDSARRKKILTHNEAELIDNRPRPKKGTNDIAENCWTADEARRFLDVARDEGPQAHAFYSLELGSRKSELGGLLWKDVDLEAGTLLLEHQLAKSSTLEFVPLKSGSPRMLDLSDELVELLKAHRQHQSEVKMRNRQAYQDHGLVFAKEARVTSAHRLGDPLAVNTIGARELDPLAKKAGVTRIKFHGLRHTAATLALAAGVPVKVVSHRLGHSKTAITLDLYSHVLPSMGKDAAAAVGSILHG